MLKAQDVAVYIINWCLNCDIPITNLKLQKLLYFVQGEYSGIVGNRLFSDDFYAWQLGPVIPKVYSNFAIFSSFTLPYQNQKIAYPLDEFDVIDVILLKYAYQPTWDLISLTQQQDPWKYHHMIFGNEALIPYKSIADYFGLNQSKKGKWYETNIV